RELEGVHPRVVVLQAGTNNIPRGAIAAEITRGLQAIIKTIREKAPEATIVVTGIFPRTDIPSALATISQVNDSLAKLADGQKIRFLNVNSKMLDRQGKLYP